MTSAMASCAFIVLFFSIAVFAISDAARHILKTTSNVTARVGQDVTINCSVFNPDYKVSWNRGDINSPLSEGMNIILSTLRICLVIVDRTESAIFMRNVSAADAGQYTCEVDSNPIMFQTVNLHIEDLPWFAEPIKNVTVREGHNASLTCVVRNLKHHQVTWLQNDTGTVLSANNHSVHRDKRFSVTHDHHSYTLHIKEVELHESGSYICQINTDPVMSQIGYLEVGENNFPYFYEPPKNVTVNKGDNATLSCIVENFGPYKMTWMHEGGIVAVHDEMFIHNSRFSISVDDKREKFLYIKNVRMSDQGRYMCQMNTEPMLAHIAYLTVKDDGTGYDSEPDEGYFN